MKQHLVIALFAALLCAPLAAALGVQEQGAQDEPVKTTEQIVREQLPSYPAGPCLVSGEELEDPVDVVHEGRLVRLCCNTCKKAFAKEPAEYMAELDKRIVAAQLPTYPLETCAVSGEKLGSMGDPIEHVTGTRLVRLCCKGCVKAVDKDPSKALAKVNAALIEAQKKTYPLDTCVVTGEKLGSMGDPIDYLYGTRLVRFCCKGCIKRFERDPQASLAKLQK